MSYKTYMLNLIRNLFKIRILETLLVKKTIHQHRESFWVKLCPNHYQYKRKTLRQVKRNGIFYALDISDMVDWYIYFGIQDAGQDRFYSLCKPGATVVDVGVNVGSTLLEFAKWVGGEGSVYGFEPHPANYERCLSNIKLNPYTNIDLLNVGVGDTKGSFFLSVVEEQNMGMNRITTNRHQEGVCISVIRLDDFVHEKQIQQIDAIKIDVEGFELRVLHGAEEVLNVFSPILFIELDDNFLNLQGDSAYELVRYLEDLGYESRHAENDELISSAYNFANCHFDLICQKSMHTTRVYDE